MGPPEETGVESGITRAHAASVDWARKMPLSTGLIQFGSQPTALFALRQLGEVGTAPK